MKCQIEENEHFRHILLFLYNQDFKAAKAARHICSVYGVHAISERTAQKWFLRFKNGDFGVQDHTHTGRPSNFCEEQLNQLIHDNPRQTTRELSLQLNCHHSTVADHLKSMGKVQKLGNWVPHLLSENNKNQRSKIAAELLARHKSTNGHKHRFLYRIVTGDEKWCLYVNMKKRREWVSPNKQATPRPKQLHVMKKMISVWWDWEGIIHYEFLPNKQTVNAVLYSQQLIRLKEAMQQKRANRQHHILLQHDNARPHTANLTKTVIQNLGWEVLPHPPYSPDLAPSDYHLFRSLSNHLQGVSFKNENDLETWLDDFFGSRTADFYRRGIDKLVQRWEEVIKKNGDYIID